MSQNVATNTFSTKIIFQSDFIYLFLEGKGGRKRGKKHRISCLLHAPQLEAWPITQASALTRNQTSNLSTCRLVLNPLSHTNEGSFRKSLIFSIR